MEQAKLVQKRKGKYMAQILEEFETKIEPHLSSGAGPDVADFKGLVRGRLNALATEATEIFSLNSTQNGVALEMRDAISPTGRP